MIQSFSFSFSLYTHTHTIRCSTLPSLSGVPKNHYGVLQYHMNLYSLFFILSLKLIQCQKKIENKKRRDFQAWLLYICRHFLLSAMDKIKSRDKEVHTCYKRHHYQKGIRALSLRKTHNKSYQEVLSSPCFAKASAILLENVLT